MDFAPSPGTQGFTRSREGDAVYFNSIAADNLNLSFLFEMPKASIKFINLQSCNFITMPTTIQVQDDVYKMRNILKKELNAESYNDVIRHLLRRSKRMDESEFGSMPGIAPFQREEIGRFD